MVCEIGLQVIEDSIDKIELDLSNQMDVLEVLFQRTKQAFDHSDDLLIIDLDEFVMNGSEIILSVEYSGTPAGKSFNFDERNGQPLIWILSQPYGAREWWPCKDYPFDKADSAWIHLTLPEGLIAGSNGKLVSVTQDDGFTCFS